MISDTIIQNAINKVNGTVMNEGIYTLYEIALILHILEEKYIYVRLLRNESPLPYERL